MPDEMKEPADAVGQRFNAIAARIADRKRQQIAEDEAEFVRDVAEDIKNCKLQESQDREALRKNPKWQQLFDDPDWKWLESQLAIEEALKAEACREWKGRAWHCLTPDEQKRVAEVQLPFDQKINKIKTLMFKMKDAAGLIETIGPTQHGRDISTLPDLLEEIKNYLPAVEMLETTIHGCSESVADNVNSYRHAAELIRFWQPELRELPPKQDVLSKELRSLGRWAEEMVSKNPQQVSEAKQTGKGGRPRDTDPDDDRKIYEAWKTGCYKTRAECARAFSMTAQDARRALDRHRKRQPRAGN